MKPGIRESELVTEQGVREEWDDIELWEKVEARQRRRTRAAIGLTALVIVLLSAIPPIWDRGPKWSALRAVRLLGQELNEIKREAATKRLAMTVSLQQSDQGLLALAVQSRPRCQGASQIAPDSVRRQILPQIAPKLLAWIRPSEAASHGIRGLVEDLCIDPLTGVHVNGVPQDPMSPPVAFGVAPAEDLATGRLDRVALLTLHGTFGEIDFH